MPGRRNDVPTGDIDCEQLSECPTIWELSGDHTTIVIARTDYLSILFREMLYLILNKTKAEKSNSKIYLLLKE